MDITQISNMDYWSLVNMLMIQITPETRKHILDRLIEMNNLLLSFQIQPDLLRSPILNTRKKDVTEIQHPSINYTNLNQNSEIFQHIEKNQPEKLNFKQFNIPINNHHLKNNSQISSDFTCLPPIKLDNSKNQNFKQKYENLEIDIDDIINEIYNQPDELDDKLDKIKKLHTKIIADKRKINKDKK